jgi:glyoxylate/succinic semialdehyde reductase
MLAQDDVALEVAFGPGGVLESIQPGKAYVDASTVGPETSRRISEAVTKKGGRYLEAPVSGTKQPAEQGKLIFLSGGDESLFTEVKPALDVLGSKSLFLGEVGNGARMKLAVNMVMGSMLNALSEGLALSEKAGLSQEALLEVLEAGAMSCGLFRVKGKQILAGEHPPSFPLKHHQKDMRLALAVGDEVGQPMPVAAAANETFKLAKSLGFGNEDTAAVYKALQGDKRS